MKSPAVNTISFILTLNTFILLAASCPFPAHTTTVDVSKFYQCMKQRRSTSNFYSPTINRPEFEAVLNSTAQNLRCIASSMPKPLLIFTPLHENHVSAAVICAGQQNLNIRVRSGGHDYEGLSYISLTGNPFIIIDLSKLRKVDVDVTSRSAWVQAGATVGELYYRISEKSPNLGFPAGLYMSIGIGGHITGGAYGSMMRKYGLGADNVVDARIVLANGTILNRRGMGEDLFWAIRGGGGGNFGIILSWKLKLVPVPVKVTVFTVPKMQESNILYKWQNVAPTIDQNLFIRVIMQVVSPTPAEKTVMSLYQGVYLGSKTDLIEVMRKSFPDLGLTTNNCTEMSWIKSVMYTGGLNSNAKPKDLLLAKPAFLNYFKAKSDFVTTAIPEMAIKGMWERFKEDAGLLMIWTPYGGKMGTFSEDSIPFCHRDVSFMIQYVVNWNDDKLKSQTDHEGSIAKLYDYMTPYVTKNPRQSYVNYRDLDLGKDERSGKIVSCPRLWGPKYFKNNFQRLVQVKSKIDPNNVFSNEQSIPTNASYDQCVELV